MKIIAIDAGNTHLRLAVVSIAQSTPLSIIHFTFTEGVDKLREIGACEGFSIPIVVASVVSSVVERITDLLSTAGFTTLPLFCDHQKSSLLRNNYSNTLGIDRYVDAAAGAHHFPGRDLIVIDSGTATTVDYVHRDRTFLGGMILPGIGLKSRAIGQWTDKLPTLNPYALTLSEMPTTTVDAVSTGLLVDSSGGIEKAIDIGVNLLDDPLIIACGGGWEIIGPYVSRNIVSMPDLTLLGTALLGFEFFTSEYQ